MVYHEYKIIEIKGVDHSKYGKCLMVYANPIIKKETSYEFKTSIDKRTFKFLFPLDYLSELQRIANSLAYWTPDADSYFKERIYDAAIELYCPVHEHINLDLKRLDMLDDETEDLNLNDGDVIDNHSVIPDLSSKWEKIINEWEQEIEKPGTVWGYDKEGGPAEYAEVECSEKAGFFSWLFDDISINSEEDLSEEQEDAYEEFLSEELDKEGASPNK